MQSDVLVPKQGLGFSGALGLGLGDFRFGTGLGVAWQQLAVASLSKPCLAFANFYTV